MCTRVIDPCCDSPDRVFPSCRECCKWFKRRHLPFEDLWSRTAIGFLMMNGVVYDQRLDTVGSRGEA